MNIVQMQDSLKDLSDQQLLQTMQTDSAPHYLVLAEMQRRKKTRQETAQRQPQGTVADEIMSGIAAVPAPNMQGFSAGGIVPFQEGGLAQNAEQERVIQMLLAEAGVPDTPENRRMIVQQGMRNYFPEQYADPNRQTGLTPEELAAEPPKERRGIFGLFRSANNNQFAEGGIVPFREGGSTRDQLLAQLRRSLTIMAVPASQKAQILSNAEMLPETALPGYVSSITSASKDAPPTVSVMDTPAAPEGQTYPAPSEYGFLDYLGETLDPYASPKAIAEGIRGTPGVLADAPSATLGLVEPVYERSKPIFGATARSYEDIYGPGVEFASDLTRELINYPGKEIKYGPAPVAPPGTTYGEGDMPPIVDMYGPDAAGEIPTVPQQKPKPDVGEEFRSRFGPTDFEETPLYTGLERLVQRLGDTKESLSDIVGKSTKAYGDWWRGEEPAPKAYPPNNEMMAREAAAAAQPASEQPAAPADSTGIGNVGRLDDSTSTAPITPATPTAPTQPKVGTEQLADMGDAELAQTREVAKERPDFFSPEALLALGLGMIAGGSKPGSTFGSAVGEGGLAMLQQVQSKRKAEAEREKEAMLEAGRMERTRMEQAGALERAGINAAAYEKQFAVLNRQRAVEYAKTFIEPLQDPIKRLGKIAEQVELLRKTDPGASEKELQQQARANIDAELEQRLKYYEQLLLGAEDSMYGAPSRSDQPGVDLMRGLTNQRFVQP